MGEYKWIGLVRKFYNCSFYNDSNAVQMFLHIFLNAQREDRPYFDQIIMRGQFRTSITNIMQFLQISRKSARRSLDKLKEAGVIHMVSQRRNGVLITVREYSKFLALENMRGGWVKLYYDLDYQDFFEEARVLHLYLHILLHTYSNNESYEDPLWFDFKKISSSTGIPVEGVKESLQKLRKTGILNVGYNGQKRLSSVRLVEFSDYIRNILPSTSTVPSISCATPTESLADADTPFVDEAFISSSEGGIKEEQKRSKEGPKDSRKDSSRNSYENATKYFVSNKNTSTYKNTRTKEGQKREQISSKAKGPKSLPNGQEGGFACEHINKENKDKRIENSYYNNYPAVRKFSSIEELVCDDEWVRSMQELYGFAGKEVLYTALTLFLANLKCRKEAVPEDMNCFLDYFCNWYKRNEKLLRPKLKIPVSLHDYGKNLWDKCMSAFAMIVSDQAFVSVFKTLVFEKYDNAAKTLTLCLPNSQVYQTLENDYVDTLRTVLHKFFGMGLRLQYRIVGN